MRYNRGQGGIVLNQLNILDREKLPLNKSKKANITKVLLANMGAVFAGTKTIVAGAGLQYEPVRIPDARFNAFVNRTGRPRWFPGPGDVSKMPVGDQTFANVDYHLSDFSTSPVPTVFMLKGSGSEVQETEVEGIEVGRAADALFFLHTFNPSGSIGGWQRQYDEAIRRGRELPEPPVVFQYVVHYADGEQAIVPVVWQAGVGSWVSDAPAALPAAAVAWTGRSATRSRRSSIRCNGTTRVRTCRSRASTSSPAPTDRSGEHPRCLPSRPPRRCNDRPPVIFPQRKPSWIQAVHPIRDSVRRDLLTAAQPLDPDDQRKSGNLQFHVASWGTLTAPW